MTQTAFPAGWGFGPQATHVPRSAPRKRVSVRRIVADIDTRPHLAAGVQADDLITHYGCSRTTAFEALCTLRKRAAQAPE